MIKIPRSALVTACNAMKYFNNPSLHEVQDILSRDKLCCSITYELCEECIKAIEKCLKDNTITWWYRDYPSKSSYRKQLLLAIKRIQISLESCIEPAIT